MRDDGEFEGFLAARWVPALRTLVMLGCSEPAAEEIARMAFARLRAGWARAREGDADVDTYVYLLEEWRRAGRARAAGAPRTEPEADAWRELEPVLDRLPYDERTALLLTHVARLDEAQRYEVLGRSPRTDRGVPGDAVREAGEAITVLAPPPERVVGRMRELRSRRRRRAASWAAVAAVVVAGGAAWAARSGDHAPPTLGVAPTAIEENLAPMAWYANGRLHLDHVVIDLPPLRSLVAVDGGAAYVDGSGAVVFVADDGARTRLGTTDEGSPLVGSDEAGWVAWSDTQGTEPVLVLYDLVSRQRLRVVTPPDPEHESATRLLPVAIDQELLYFRTESGTSYLVAPEGVAQHVGLDLLDVASATRVFQSDPDSIRMLQPFFSTVTAGLGVGAQLSPDGNLVVTRTDDGPSPYGTVRLYDARSGDLLPSGLSGDDVAIDAAFGPDNTITYIVARLADRPSSEEFIRQSFSGALQLRTCEVEAAVPSCRVDTTFPSTGSTPLLGPTT